MPPSKPLELQYRFSQVGNTRAGMLIASCLIKPDPGMQMITTLWYGILVSPRKTVEGEDEGQGAGRATSDRDLSEFLLRACHDLRSSLRAIRAHAELVQKGVHADGTSDLDKSFAFIANGARRIELLADGLSSYSIALQIEEASFQPARMDVMLRTALARVDREIHERGADVTCSELPQVSGKPDRLVQVFEILLHNALRHGGQSSPRIHVAAEKVTAEKKAEEWLFTVRDNGLGIDAAYLERVFRPFERLHATEREGAGMGLAICRAIVERHGGRLWAESTPATGSTFLFTLPVADR
jgi:light-regulated signal transduction histidine kinase (bacteriophytochrome)